LRGRGRGSIQRKGKGEDTLFTASLGACKRGEVFCIGVKRVGEAHATPKGEDKDRMERENLSHILKGEAR